MFKYWSLFLSCESWSKRCECRSWGLVALITTLMGCRQSIFVDESNIDFPIFLLFFNTKFPIFPIFSILSFLFFYFFEHPWRWTPWHSYLRAHFKPVCVASGSHVASKRKQVFHFPWQRSSHRNVLRNYSNDNILMGRGCDKDLFTTQIEYATCTSPLMHLIPPPPKKIANLCFSFLLGITTVPRETENNVVQNFGWGGGGEGGQIRCIMGDLQVAYANFLRRWYSSPTSDNRHQQV